MNRNALRLLAFIIVFPLTSSVLVGQYSLQVYTFCSGNQAYLDVYTKLPTTRLAGRSVTRELYLTDGRDTVYGDRAIATLDTGAVDFFDLHRVKVYPTQYQVHVVVSAEGVEPIQMVTTEEVSTCDTRLLSDIVVTQSITACQGGHACKYGRSIEPLPGHMVVDTSFSALLYVEAYLKPATPVRYLSYGVKSADGETLLSSFKALGRDSLQPLVLPLSGSVPSLDRASIFVTAHNVDKKKLYTTSTSFSFDNYLEIMPKVERMLSVFDTLSAEDLIFDLKSLIPVVGSVKGSVIAQLVKDKRPRHMRRFLKKYWYETHGQEATDRYRAYRRVAQAVHHRFYNTVGYGIETDRGYVYLKYGKPNDMIAVEDEPDAPPYQIWRYNYITETQQSNVKFIFYNPSLVTNDYYLLHSTCRGEFQNPRWEVDLYSKAPWDQTDNTVDVTEMKDGHNRQARRLFESL